MKDKAWIKLSSIYIGTIIGAGFASGQEIMQFFGGYGYRGLFGVMIASFLFSTIGATVMYSVYKYKIKGYEDFIKPILGYRLSKLVEIIISLFLFTSYCVMLAGSGAIFYQQFQLSYTLGIYIMALCTLLTFLFSIKGISVVNVIIVPLLLIGIIIIGIMIILKEGLVFSNLNYGSNSTITGNWLISSILYVSYNSISAIVIITSLLSIIKNKKAAIKGGVFGGIGLGILALFILIPLLILYTDVYNVEIPMLKVAGRLGNAGKYIYSLILWGAMFTTAIASGYGFIRRISTLFNINEKFFSIIFCFISIPLASIGFSNLVLTLYPIFGYLGFIMLVLVFGSLIYRKGKNIF
ncbi:hypothetical protein [Caldisalinibacter kiritimatiensis]|uniref:Membrane protein YkvI n=1 Tax=Caldisalinibacter kiritimatiensis TaxID=1304284 RepID=R1CMX9_9FIRM|nr:hypothetical protein [Caldisalinibacter kiritimatiensis]EOD00046.1 hypothetical protein L21TH_1935 [Caldisalinibacter kiritimatiensis]